MYRPDSIAFEELFFNKNVTTAINRAARGAALVAASERTEQLYEYTPLQISRRWWDMDGRIKPGADDGKDDPVPKGKHRAGRRGGRGGGGDLPCEHSAHTAGILLTQRSSKARRPLELKE